MNNAMNKFLGSVALAMLGVHAQADDVASNAFLRDNLRSLGDEVAAYRPALSALVKDVRLGTEARAALLRIDALMAESAKLAQQAKLQEAVQQGEAAKRLAIQSMVKLKSGETVTHALKFDTPADEYAYELRRFDSNEMLVTMNLAEAADVGARQRVAGELDEARRLKQSAASEAATGRHGDAVKQMEAASGHLTRALQALGVPVF